MEKLPPPPQEPGPEATLEERKAYREMYVKWRNKYYPIKAEDRVDHFDPLLDNFGGRSTTRGISHSA